MLKKTFTVSELKKLSPEELIEKIKYKNYSLLTTLNAEKMRKEMVPVGKVCHYVANYFLKSTGPKNNEEKHIKNARKKIVKTLQRITPAKYKAKDFPTDSEEGLVIGFNHPSLGEIPRLIKLKVDIMGDKPMLFPVNLPWYEAIARDYKELEKLGIIITPTITPSTWKKLNISEKDPYFEVANKLKRDFREIYTKLSIDMIKKGGVIFVAPPATRQATVFKTKDVYDKKEDIIPTMSVLAIKLYKDKEMNCNFLPLAVVPPKNYGRSLNLFKTYELRAGDLMTAKDIRKKYFKEKSPKRLENFDYDFHTKIAEKLPKEFWY